MIAESAEHLTLFQRSANHIFPKPDSAIPRWWRQMIPYERGLWWFFGEQFSRGLDDHSRVGRVNRKVALEHLKKFEFVEREPEQPVDEEPGFKEFLGDPAFSGDTTVEEIKFLRALRFTKKRPTSLYYYRELQNLRDRLHFRTP